jgi:hypothetical protein
MRRAARLLIATAATATAVLLGGCAIPFKPGQTEAEVIAAAGPPTGRYVMPDGTRRLEYATGPMGRHTWMVDLDAQGRVQQVEQVLSEMTFLKITDGMARDDVLRLIGRPAHRQREWMNKETWFWRYPTNDCLWVGVTMLPPDWKVQHGAGYLPDPICDDNDRGDARR